MIVSITFVFRSIQRIITCLFIEFILKSHLQIIVILLSSGLAVSIIPASGQISQERLDVEIAQMDVISQCDTNLTLLGASPSEGSAEEVLSSCDRLMSETKNYCIDHNEFTTCSDERIEGYLTARGQ